MTWDASSKKECSFEKKYFLKRESEVLKKRKCKKCPLKEKKSSVRESSFRFVETLQKELPTEKGNFHKKNKKDLCKKTIPKRKCYLLFA